MTKKAQPHFGGIFPFSLYTRSFSVKLYHYRPSPMLAAAAPLGVE